MAIQTVLVYPGAKWKAWTQIEPLIPDGIIDWREPFFGGGSVSLLMAENPRFNLKRMLVGDLASEVWAFWKGAQTEAQEVMKIAKEWFNEICPTHEILINTPENLPQYSETYDKAIEEAKKLWEFLQTVDCGQLDIPHRAARMFLTNRVSFSGMGDSGTLSKDRFTSFRMAHLNRIKLAQPLLKKMEIINASFEETMADTDEKETFIFLDPPYYTQESSGLYGRGGDTHKGFPHHKLADMLLQEKCRWLMTYDDSVAVRRMYRGMYMKEFNLTYTMAMVAAEDALAGEELFIANYDINGETEIPLSDLL